MVRLFLTQATSDKHGDGDAMKERMALLEKLESIIASAMICGGRHEARLWLCKTISSIHTITPREQCNLFIELLRFEESKHDIAAQLLQMIFENKPEKAAYVLAKKSGMLEKFFKGHPRRILDWFDHFASFGESVHRKGARALSKFAFMNRDSCWEELEWKGRHGQSPAVVATKPHYFHDLDVLRTVENFLKYVPEFWESEELAESVKDGEILKIDRKYFIDKFLHLMYGDNMEDLWVLVKEFIMGQQFSFLCQHLLIILDDSRMLTFLKSIGKFIPENSHCKELKYRSCWLEGLLSTCNDSISIDEVILMNAVISHRRQLLHLMTDEEHENEKQKVDKLLLNSLKFCDTDHWTFMQECIKLNNWRAIKWIGLQSWLVHYHLAMECKTEESCESLFMGNGINFCKAEEFDMLLSNEIFEEHSSEIGDKDLDKCGYNKRKRDKKRRKKKQYHTRENADVLMDFGSNRLHDLKSGGSSWLLSIDNYSCTWNAADLPEHLADHCFSTWMKWFLSEK